MKFANPRLRRIAILLFAFAGSAHGAYSPIDLTTVYSGSPFHSVATSVSQSYDLSNLSGLTPGETIKLQFIPAAEEPITMSSTFIYPAGPAYMNRTATVEIAAGGQLLTYTTDLSMAPLAPKGAWGSITSYPLWGSEPVIHTLEVPWGTDLSNVTITLRDNSTIWDSFFLSCSIQLRGTLTTTGPIPEPPEPEPPTDGEMAFAAADLDDSSTLSKVEFTATINATAKILNRHFKMADRNGNGAISLAEYLIYVGEQEAPTKEESSFIETDLNSSSGIDFDEFLAASPAKNSIISLIKSFLIADDDGNDLLSLEEWTLLKKGKAKPAQGESFLKYDLADFNGDDQLTRQEFSLVFPRGTPEAKVVAKFNRLDGNLDGVITRSEWNPGGERVR
jgi:Ca2+-binding EF-hand superfamily protein